MSAADDSTGRNTRAMRKFEQSNVDRGGEHVTYLEPVEVELVELYECAWSKVVLAHGHRSTKTKSIRGRYRVAHRDGCARARSLSSEVETIELTLLGPVALTEVDPMTACAWCLADVANPAPADHQSGQDAQGGTAARSMRPATGDGASERVERLARPQLKATSRPNRYPGRCRLCGSTVAPGAGRLASHPDGGWAVVHRDGECIETRKRARR